MLEWETVRFDQCSEILWKVLQTERDVVKEPLDRYGVIYSDIPFPKAIKAGPNILITYQGRIVVNNTQVHFLAVNSPKNLDIFLTPDLSEALACILSFSLRTRFTASRHWSHIDKEGKLAEPLDLFLRMSSAFAGPFAVRPISPTGIQNRVGTFSNILGILRRMSAKDFKRVIRSLRLYQLALLTYTMDVGLAYSLLVSSVDNLSCKLYDSESLKEKFVSFIKQYLPGNFWTGFDSRAWEEDRWLDSITPWERSIVDFYRERYEKDGEKALSSLKGTLSENAIERLKNVFEEKTELPSEEKQAYDHVLQHWYLYRLDMKLTPNELPEILGRIFEEVRSAFFHGGRSPPQSAIDRYETAPIKPKFKGNGTVIWQRDIPSFYTFERMAHDSILGYLLIEFQG